MYELVKSGLNRKYLLWFCVLTGFFIVVLSGWLNITEGNISNYLEFSKFIILSVVLSKAHDTHQKFKKDKQDLKSEGDKKDA